MAIKRTYVYRNGKIVEVTPGDVLKRINVQTFGEAHDNMHACYVMDEIRQQHMIDSNRAENAYNKKMRG
jgi:hypothetical protein